MPDKNEIILSGLSCANCAAVIEDKINDLPWVKEARFNLATQILTLNPEEGALPAAVKDEIQALVDRIEDGVVVLDGSQASERSARRQGIRASLLIRLPEIAGALLFFFLVFFRKPLGLAGSVAIPLFAAAYLLIGRSVLLSALKNIRNGRGYG